MIGLHICIGCASAPAGGAFLKEAIAVLRDQINTALKDAMKAGDTRRVSTLRLINADILKRETSAAERVSLNDAEILDVMGKMIKQRQESLDIYEKAGRAELAASQPRAHARPSLTRKRALSHSLSARPRRASATEIAAMRAAALSPPGTCSAV